jgi:hypothetical protein
VALEALSGPTAGASAEIPGTRSATTEGDALGAGATVDGLDGLAGGIAARAEAGWGVAVAAGAASTGAGVRLLGGGGAAPGRRPS